MHSLAISKCVHTQLIEIKSFLIILKKNSSAWELYDMVQHGKELAAKRDKVSLTPGTHTVEGENQLQQVVL